MFTVRGRSTSWAEPPHSTDSRTSSPWSGHRWPEGDIEIGNSLQAEFLNAKSLVDRTLSLIGYDIDKGREVAVFVNGRKLGVVSEGDDKGYSKTNSFRIPAAYQIEGRNVIVIRQDKRMQYPWGVKDILVE